MATLTTTTSIEIWDEFFKNYEETVGLNITPAYEAVSRSLEIALDGVSELDDISKWTPTGLTSTIPEGFFTEWVPFPPYAIPQRFYGGLLDVKGSGFTPIAGGTDIDPNDTTFTLNEINGRLFNGKYTGIPSTVLDANGLPIDTLAMFSIKGNLAVVNENLTTASFSSVSFQAANGLKVSLAGPLTFNPNDINSWVLDGNGAIRFSAPSVVLNISYDTDPSSAQTLTKIQILSSLNVSTNGDVSGIIKSISFDDGDGHAFSLTGLNLSIAEAANFSTIGEFVAATTSGNADVVVSSATYQLENGIENLTLTGSADVDGTGNSVGNKMAGNSGANTLDGGAGKDTLTGGAGNDTYVVDNSGDIVTETAVGTGSALTDTVESSVSWTLGANIENLTLIGADNINGTGNGAANQIIGNSGNNILDGKAGADTLIGGLGNDTYILDNPNDVVAEGPDGGIDTIQIAYNNTTTASIEINLDEGIYANIENVIVKGTGLFSFIGDEENNFLAGNASVNTIVGNGGDDVLDGGVGADSMQGGSGNDTYFVDNSNDKVEETDNIPSGPELGRGLELGDTIDKVVASINYLLLDYVEDLTLTGAALIGTGNELDNILVGNVGANKLMGLVGTDTLDGGGGADTLEGGADDDTYHVDNIGDKIVEAAEAGTDDAVRSSVNYTLAANVEHLTLTGSAAINAFGNALDNTISGNSGSNVIDGAVGNDVLDGGAGNDIYLFTSADHHGQAEIADLGVSGIDEVRFAATATVPGGATLTLYAGDTGIERVVIGTGSVAAAVATGTVGFGIDASDVGNALTLIGNAGANSLIGTDYGDTLDGGAGADSLVGGEGNDTYVVDNAGDVVDEDGAVDIDIVRTSFNNYTLGGGLENLTLIGAAAIGTGNDLQNMLVGSAGANKLYGLDGTDTLDGGAGADTLEGGTEDDTYHVDNIGDKIVELNGEGTDVVHSSVTYTLSANVENLTLAGSAAINAVGNELDNSITGNNGNNVIDGAAGNDVLDGGAGNDIYFFTSAAHHEQAEIADSGIGGSDEVRFAATATVPGGATLILHAGDTGIERAVIGTGIAAAAVATGTVAFNIDASAVGNALTLIGNAGANSLIGTDHGDALDGGAGNDTLTGNGGADSLDGGLGADSLVGGEGNDTYVVDNAGDVVDEDGAVGIDIVRTSFNNYTLGDMLENLTLIGAAANGTGNDLDNFLTGNAVANKLKGGRNEEGLSGADTLDGGAGADTLEGGAEDDTYIVDNIGDKIVEFADEGTDDAVQSSVTYTLAANVENLTLTGSGAINAFGNGLDNTISGNSGSNVIDGAVGNDVLDGGAGNDIYLFTSADHHGQAEIADSGLSGIDEVRFAATATVPGGATLTLYAGDTGIERVVIGTGIAAAAVTTGTVAFNIDASAVDNALTMIGNAGANSLIGTDYGDSLSGGAGNDTLIGNTGADTLDGGTGADSLAGGDGDDVYVVDSTGDIVFESGLADTADKVLSSISFDLSVKGANIENLTLTGVAAINATGNALANTLTGNTGANTLDGGIGTDWLVGGNGSDTYKVDSALDVVVESLGQGTDLVMSTASYTLSNDVENLTLTGDAAISGTGNEMKNLINGSVADNMLDGGAGADTLKGGAGNDTYTVDIVKVGSGATATVALQDAITENLNEGVADTLVLRGYVADLDKATTLTLGANLENIDASNTFDTKLNLTGNTLNNTLVGNAADNVLDGGLLADKLTGGEGDDTYVVDNTGDVLFEEGTYFDVFGEEHDGGTDTVRSSITWELDLHFENLTLTGSANINGDGNDLDNLIIGNAGKNILTGYFGADTLDGGAGADTLVGGDGEDTYVVDNTGDVIIEDGFFGMDTVRSSIAFDLGAHENIENLTLTGSAAIKATGDEFNNRLTGNSGANSLIGNAGEDILDGGAGADYMEGGDDDDGYFVDNVGDKVVETDPDGGSDWVESSIGFTLGTNVEDLELTGNGAINGTGNALANSLTGNAGANVLDGKDGDDELDGGFGNDILIGGIGNDELDGGIGSDLYLIATPEEHGESETIDDSGLLGTDEIRFTSATAGAELTLRANIYGIERVVIGTGTAAAAVLTGTTRLDIDASQVGAGLSILGNAGINVLTGTGFADSLSGGAGNDTLIGGNGNDTLDGGAGTDSYAGGLGDDTYVIESTAELAGISDSDGSNTARIMYATAASQTLIAGGVDFEDIENITVIGTGLYSLTGNGVANALIGNGSANSLAGMDGDDYLEGGAGNDILDGGDGNDTMDGGAGADSFDGGLGDDTYVIDSTAELAGIVDGDGNNTVVIMYATAGSETLTAGSESMASFENITVMGAGLYNLAGTDNANVLIGNASANSLDGFGGDDYLGGGADDDTLSGGDGDDTLDGGEGRDTLTGGDGNDTYVVDHAGDLVTESGVADTADMVLASISYDLSVEFATTIENLTLTGTGTINGTGNDLANRLTGNAGANTLIGGGGIDTLDGGTGMDDLVGGANSDIFSFTTTPDGFNVDSVLDFISGEDLLALDDAIFTGLSGGVAPETILVEAGATAATDSTQRLIYDTANGALYYDSDGVGGAASSLVAYLYDGVTVGSHPATLSHIDFDIV